MQSITRRDVLGMGAALGLAATGLVGGATAALAEPVVVEENVPEDLSDLAMYRPNVSFADLTAARRFEIDACEDYVKEDGTVVPKVFVQMRAVMDGLGYGDGHLKGTDDTSFDIWMRLADNDEDIAAVYVKSPIGVRFTALDASVATGLPEQQCKEALDQLSWNGAMVHVKISGLDYYQHQRMYHGVVETSMNLYYDEDFVPMLGQTVAGGDRMPFPSYYPVPIGLEVVADEAIYPYDDIEGLLQRHTSFAVAPCQCHLMNDDDPQMPELHDREAIIGYVANDGTHLEKCVVFGDEAEYYVEQGIARAITREECRDILRRSYDEGCVLQSNFTKYTEVICSCSGPCGVLGGARRMEKGSQKYANTSHYNLTYDADACIKCGMCAGRCPMQAIEMTGEEGRPEVTGLCIRCGQCAYICPMEARKLTLKPADEIPDMPDDLLDWANKDAMFRLQAGMWDPYAGPVAPEA